MTLHVHHVPAHGGPSGPAVLLVHGLASSGGADWPDASWATRLAAAGRDVLVVDLPGHGASAPLDAPMPTSAAVAQLAAVASGREVDVVAYSLGARLAWELAAVTPVRRLVLGGLAPFEPFAAFDVASARAALAGGPAPADPLTGMIFGMLRAPGNDPASLVNLIEGLAAEPFDPAVAPPRHPVLLVAGADDPMAQGVDGLAALVPDATAARVPGDHVGALHSDQFRSAAFAFLGVEA